jgi:hypothetical protein
MIQATIIIFLAFSPLSLMSGTPPTPEGIRKEIYLDELLSAGNFTKIKQLFDEKYWHASDPYYEPPRATFPLTYVIKRGCFTSAIVPLLKAGFEINGHGYYPPLVEAINYRSKAAVKELLSNKIQAPKFSYEIIDEQEHVLTRVQRHAAYYHQGTISIGANNALCNIGQAIIQFEGLYTYRRRIAKKGLAQRLPTDVVKIIAMHCEYPSLE